MNFQEAMKSGPPYLAVMFARQPDGTEVFQWGIVAPGTANGQRQSIPILSLIGHICALQAHLADERWVAECTEDALVVVWDEETRQLSSYLHHAIPRTPLIGYLETVKQALVGSKMGMSHAAQQVRPRILGPDGLPMPE